MNSLNRRQFMKTAGVAVAAAALPGRVRCASRAKAAGGDGRGGTNVLFLMTDEQHHRSLSLTGNPYITTPHMDRIGREGVVFENATCVTPYCSPSRASMITGVYPHRHGILVNVGGGGGANGQAPLDQGAFANTEMTLHGRGYAAAFRGKWHLGDLGDFECYESFGYGGRTPRDYQNFLKEKFPAAEAETLVEERERSTNYGVGSKIGTYLGRPVAMTPAMRKAAAAFATPENRLGYIATIGRSVVPPELLPETQITNQVLELIEQNKDKNFMITASWSPPHDLWVIPEPYYSMVDRAKIELPGTRVLPEWDQRGPSKKLGEAAGDEGLREYAAIYHGMVKYIDDQVGRVLAKLDELGLAENTLVLFTSDHGDMVGAHGCIGKSIGGYYDDLVRIPLLMRLPGRIKPGTVVSRPVSQIDYMPTILDYAGAGAAVEEKGKIHGRSLRPLIEGREEAWRDYAFCQRASQSRMLRTAEYKYVTSADRKMEALYDLKNDAHEDRNLAGDPAHAAALKMMRGRLLEVMAADGDPMLEAYRKGEAVAAGAGMRKANAGKMPAQQKEKKAKGKAKSKKAG